MPITLEALSARLAQLQADALQLRDATNATAGAIQDCQHWIDELSKPAPEAQ